jgi:hypothetical protein
VKYKVTLYWDGPVFRGEGAVAVEADSEGDAVREALAYAGLPKIGEVTPQP